MEFGDFAQTLKPILAEGDTAGAFVRRLFEEITSIPESIEKNPLIETQDPTFKAYYTGDRKLSRFAPKIVKYVDTDKFADYIDSAGLDAQMLIFEELGDCFEKKDNPVIADETAQLFKRIIFSYVKKKVPAKKKKAALAAQNIKDDEPVKKEDFPLLAECNMRCPLCRKKLVESIKGQPLQRYVVTPIFPAWLDNAKQSDFSAVQAPPQDLESLDNKMLLCRNCAEEYLVAPSAEEYRNLVLIKRQQRSDLSLQDNVDDILVEQGIRQILDALSDIKESPKPIDKSKWEAFRVDKKIPDDNFRLQDRVTYWVLRYYRYLEAQFKQGERTRRLRFRKIQNEVSQCFETYDEANKSQNEIFELLVKWLEDQTGCHNRDSLETMISFFVQNCEVFYEIAE